MGVNRKTAPADWSRGVDQHGTDEEMRATRQAREDRARRHKAVVR